MSLPPPSKGKLKSAPRGNKPKSFRNMMLEKPAAAQTSGGDSSVWKWAVGALVAAAAVGGGIYSYVCYKREMAERKKNPRRLKKVVRDQDVRIALRPAAGELRDSQCTLQEDYYGVRDADGDMLYRFGAPPRKIPEEKTFKQLLERGAQGPRALSQIATERVSLADIMAKLTQWTRHMVAEEFSTPVRKLAAQWLFGSSQRAKHQNPMGMRMDPQARNKEIFDCTQVYALLDYDARTDPPPERLGLEFLRMKVAQTFGSGRKIRRVMARLRKVQMHFASEFQPILQMAEFACLGGLWPHFRELCGMLNKQDASFLKEAHKKSLARSPQRVLDYDTLYTMSRNYPTISINDIKFGKMCVLRWNYVLLDVQGSDTVCKTVRQRLGGTLGEKSFLMGQHVVTRDGGVAVSRALHPGLNCQLVGPMTDRSCRWQGYLVTPGERSWPRTHVLRTDVSFSLARLQPSEVKSYLDSEGAFTVANLVGSDQKMAGQVSELNKGNRLWKFVSEMNESKGQDAFKTLSLWQGERRLKKTRKDVQSGEDISLEMDLRCVVTVLMKHQPSAIL